MKLLHCIETLGRGGAEQALVNVLPALKKKGYNVSVAALWPPYTLASQLESAGVKVYRLNLSWKWNVAQGIRRLNHIIQSGKYDVIHSHLFFAGFYTSLSGLISKNIRKVVTFHNLGYDSYPADSFVKKIRKSVDGWLMRNTVDCWLAVSRSVSKHYSEHLGIPKPHVVANCTSVRLQAHSDSRKKLVDEIPLETNDFLIIVVGRLVHEKGHRFLIKALQNLHKQSIHPKTVIVGDGPLAHQLESEIISYGLEDEVFILGAVPHQKVLEFVSASDLFVLPSTHEGFGLAVLEAMALGKPVIATRVGGVPELLRNGENGLLIQAGDPESLLNAILSVMSDTSLAGILRSGAIQTVNDFYRPDTIASRLDCVYKRLLPDIPEYKKFFRRGKRKI